MSERDDDLIRGRGDEMPGELTETQIVRARQRSRARVMAVLLGAFVLLIFAISIVKITQGYGP